MKSRHPWFTLLILVAVLACNLQTGIVGSSHGVAPSTKPLAVTPQETSASSQTEGGIFPPALTDNFAVPTEKPSPTVVRPYLIQETLKYESPKEYLCDANACWRTDGRLLNTSEYFFPNPDESNVDIQALLADIGLPSTPPSDEKEEWERVMVIWNWLSNHNKETSNPEGKTGMQYLSSLSVQASQSHWPSLADWAKVYARYQFIPWEGCNFKAFFFGIILHRSGLSPDHFAVAETYWDVRHSGQHLYGILLHSGHWYYVDPTCVNSAALSSTPKDVGCTTADYRHPFGLAVLPGSHLTKPMLLEAPE
jgi:hypothetical protein